MNTAVFSVCHPIIIYFVQSPSLSNIRLCLPTCASSAENCGFRSKSAFLWVIGYCFVEVTTYFWPKCQAKYEQLESTQEWTSSEILQLYKIVVQIRSRLRLSSAVPWFNWEKELLKHFEPITKKTLNKDQSNLKNNTKPQPLWNVICYLKLSLKLLFYFLLQFRSTRHLTLI